ncbi:hypothetical protein RMATCC62417_12305 [Rhizopus microsporus]|nr:hypothetical protein RMATCC62417_12305 [Rhizopus microsporus]
MTMTTIHQLPTDILDLVFQHTERTTLKNCRLVCILWYLLTTPYLFRSIQINNTSQIDEFISFHANPASGQLVQIGEYVKRVTTGRSRRIFDEYIALVDFENFENFVRYCPGVTSVSISWSACRGSLYYYLLEVDDNIKWKLQRLDRNTENQRFTLDYYYKYKDTIKVIRWLKDIQDFHFVIDFPLLEELALPSTAVVTDIQDFMFICNACSNLTEIDLYTNMNDNSRLVVDFAICPSLKTLYVKCRSLIPKVLVDYITTSLVNLSYVAFWIEITSIQANFSEIYKQLKDFLFTPQKEVAYLTLKAEVRYRDNNEQIYTMIDDCLNVACRLSKLKTCNSIKWTVTSSSVLIIDLRKSWNHTIECQISIPSYLFNGLIATDDFTSSKMPNFHKLCLEEEYIGQAMSKTVALFINKACNLQELTFHWHCLQNTHNCVYESVQILRFESSICYPDFVAKLAISFPNLKELHLYKTNMNGNPQNFRHRLIHLGDLSLQKLSLTTDKAFDFAKISAMELVSVKTGNGHQYIKVCANGIPKTITNGEGAALWKRLAAEHKYLIVCNAPAHFELNNVYIELIKY